MSDCDTPRTDKAERTADTLGVMDAFEYAIYHGQKLELELNDANERIKRLEKQIEELNSNVVLHERIRALKGRMFSSKECDNPQEIIDILNKNFGDLV